MATIATPEMERMTARITFHLKPSVSKRLDRAVAASPWEQPDFLRHWLEDTLQKLEMAEFEGIEIDQEELEELPLAVQLAAAKAQIEGLKEHNSLLNHRLGLADAQNVELSKNLNISLGTVDRVTMALPAGPTPTTTPKAKPGWTSRLKYLMSGNPADRHA